MFCLYNPRVTQTSAPETRILQFQFGLIPRVAILATLFFFEKVFLGDLVDFRQAQAAEGLGAVLRAVQHWGFRFAVAFAAAVLVFGVVRASPRLKSVDLDVRTTRVRAGWILAHILSIAVLAPLTHLLYGAGATSLPFVAVVPLWALFGAAALLAASLAMMPWPLWRDAGRALGSTWLYAAAVALLGIGAWQWSERLWAPTAGLTFNLVQRLLLPIIPTLSANASTRILATDRFAVEITEVCSGLEGMGLMLVFTVAWLLYFRKEYIFPRALLLIPVGLAAMFALNVVRIAALMLIGYAGFPDVAAYGFHSQAGWIAFNSVACGLAFLSRRSSWLNHGASEPAAAVTTDNPTAVYLMPLLAILAAGVLSQAASSGFEIFYPLRPAAGLLVLALYRRKLVALDWHWSWRGPAVGALVFLMWIFAAHYLLPASFMPEKLTSLPAALRGFWIASRIAGSILIVPIAEELAYRGYLMRRLISADFESVPFHSVRWLALIATAVVFGLAHGAFWLPGIVAGLAYGLIVIRRGSLGEAVAAHATTNVLIAVTVLAGNQWQLW
jgi:exosortase E/protease (VPEID-CTERM system)